MHRPTIAVVAGHPLQPNMEAELLTLGKMLDRRFETHLVVGESAPPESLRRSFDLVYTVKPPWIDYRSIRYSFRASREYLNDYAPKIIFNIAQQIPVGLAVAMVGRSRQVTTLLRIAGESFLQHRLEETALRRIRKWCVHRKGVELACKLADHVLTLGPVLRSQILEAGISSDKVSALPNLFDSRRFQLPSLSRREAKETLGLDASKRVILFVGRLTEMKGADRVLEIVNGVKEKDRDVQFCLVGDGPMRAAFESFPHSLVALTGRVPYDQMPTYYQASDLLIHPSRSEGLPNVILEAIAAGLPVMAAPVGEIESYVAKTSSNPEAFINYILQEEWEKPPWPDWFDWTTHRNRYISFFNDLIN